jgi:hypothetical protein
MAGALLLLNVGAEDAASGEPAEMPIVHGNHTVIRMSPPIAES